METEIDLMRFGIAFLVVLALMFLLSWGLKKAGLATMPTRFAKHKRLSIVEHLPIDHRRRVILVRRDSVEHLVLLSPDGDCVIETGIPVSADQLATENDLKTEAVPS